ncbi:MAG: DNA polymerase ligase N-terminal domain-containing protein [Desulfofustis sp.]
MKKSENDGADISARFVIQKHDASQLHYDFRIEADGVLKSWAVPKGPSTDPCVKRLAVPTEDHNLDYGDFEGTIPEGEHGSGRVMIWDRGTYQNTREDNDGNRVPISACLDEGELKLWLNGKKIRGGYVLVRTNNGDDERWLLIKMDDDEADARRNPVSTENLSVVSGRDLDEIAAEKG